MKPFLFVLIVLDAILVLGILFDLEAWLNNCFLSSLILHLKEIYKNNSNFNFVNIVTSLGVLIGLFVAQLRNEAMTKQTKSQYALFNADKQFSNYLEATNLLTNKDSTVEAKIAALFSLADVAREHDGHIDRIIQVINKELIPLIKAIESNADTKTYTSKLKEKYVVKKLASVKKETHVFDCTKNKLISIGSFEKSRKIIKGWQYNGNEAERIVSVALYVIRKITLEVKEAKFDFSNTVFFDFNNDFNKNIIKKKFIRESRYIENAIFIDCKLMDFNFKKTNFHFCKFINCNLKDAEFNDANLWGTSFENCNIEKIKFTECECEGVIFKDCKKLTIKQLDSMLHRNIAKVKGFEFDIKNIQYKKEDLKYLIIIDDATLEKINNTSLTQDKFLTLEEYTQWKDNDKS